MIDSININDFWTLNESIQILKSNKKNVTKSGCILLLKIFKLKTFL